jgi:hypothetical protein
MPTARIYQRPKNSMQSGKARTDKWQLEFEPVHGKKADPLTGWSGGESTLADQVRLGFPTAEAAVAYAEKHGHDYVIVPAPEKTLKLQSYADNFR